VTGSYFELVLPSGTTLPTSNIPIDQTIMNVAKGKSTQVFRTITIGTQSYRELIVPLAKNSVVNCPTGVCPDLDHLGATLHCRYHGTGNRV